MAIIAYIAAIKIAAATKYQITDKKNLGAKIISPATTTNKTANVAMAYNPILKIDLINCSFIDKIPLPVFSDKFIFVRP